MNRLDLKEIVKECLIEIMLEGLDKRSVGPAVLPTAQPNERKKSNENADRAFPKRSNVHGITYGQPTLPPKKTHINPEVVNAFPKEQRDIMQSIFEDTARTTLVAQVSADKSPARAAMLETNVSDDDPMKIFEGASNWSDIAFAPSKRTVQNN
jgi:hypothetical protein